MSRRGGGNDRDRNEITKNIKQGPVDVDYDDPALVVHYEIEMVEVDERGATIAILDRKPEMRRIKIKSLSPDKNMAQLAADIIDKCRYIHPSRTEEIEQLLIKLRKHFQSNPGGSAANSNNMANYQNQDMNIPLEDNFVGTGGKKSDSRGRTASGTRKNNMMMDEVQERRGGGGSYDDHYNAPPPDRRRGEVRSPVDTLPPADMNQLDEYLEMLYQVSGKSDREKEQGLRKQEEGTAMILKLCRDVMNLEQLIQNSTVMGAITRVLQEEYKKSIELTYNILRIFLSFSNFSEMHSLMANYKIGVLTMKAIDFEIKRIELRETERQEREAELQAELQQARAESGQNEPLPKLLERQRKIREKELLKNKQFFQKQQKVFFVAFYILLNLAEDVTVERKMIKKGLITQLLAVLESPMHNSTELIEMVLRFLKKLSVYEENKDALKELKIIPLLLRFVTCSSDVIVKMVLRLLFNLSFDKDCREQMLRNGYIPKLVQLLKISKLRAKVLRLLYHLSVDDRCKSMITYTDAMPLLMGLVINIPEDKLPGELAALMINLSYYPKNCELMIQNRGLNLLMDRFSDKKDPLLMKIIRNISLWTFNQQQDLEAPEVNYKYRALWTPHIKVLLEMLLETNNQDLMIEIVGCLANMTVYDLPATSNWSKLIKEYSLMNYLAKLLVPGLTQNDLILEIIMLISTMATDPAACSILATGNLIPTLYQLFKEKTEDVEITLQLLNCFHKLLYTQSSREVVMYSTRIFADIIEGLSHRNSAIRAKTEKMSEFVYEYDRKATGELGSMARSIVKKRFEQYNKQWLTAVFGSTAPVSGPPSASYGPRDSNNSLYGANNPLSYSEDTLPGRGDVMDYDRLPSSQEHVQDLVNSARYFDGKIDHSLDWQLDGSNKTHAPPFYNVQDISKLDDEEDDDLDYNLHNNAHQDVSYDFQHMQQTQSEIDSWNQASFIRGGGNGGYYK